MRTRILLLTFVLIGAMSQAQTQSGDDSIIVEKERGVLIRAPKNVRWCEYGHVRLQPAQLDLQGKEGKPKPVLNEKQREAADKFIAQLNLASTTAFQGLIDKKFPGDRTLVIQPRLLKLSRNSALLNVVGLAAMQSPIKGSGLVLQLDLMDQKSNESVASVILAGKGFLASQVDLKRYRYALSSLGQAQAVAKARLQEAARQIDEKLTCDAPGIAK